MRYAIPLLNDCISPVLDTAERLEVVEVSDGKIISRRGLFLSGDESRDKARFIAQHADILVCGAISRDMYMQLSVIGVKIYPWYMGNVNEIIEILSNGSIPGPQYVMPGCRRNRRGVCGRRKEFSHSRSSGNTMRQRLTVRKGQKQ